MNIKPRHLEIALDHTNRNNCPVYGFTMHRFQGRVVSDKTSKGMENVNKKKQRHTLSYVSYINCYDVEMCITNRFGFRRLGQRDERPNRPPPPKPVPSQSSSPRSTRNPCWLRHSNDYCRLCAHRWIPVNPSYAHKRYTSVFGDDRPSMLIRQIVMHLQKKKENMFAGNESI